ncbi:universal stress protein [candidate division KSB1 bacterium]
MIHIKDILFPTDFSDCSREALKYAVRLCGMFDAKLHILHVITLFGENAGKAREGFPNTEKLIQYYEEQSQYELEEIGKVTKNHNVDCLKDSVKGYSVAEEILAYEKKNKADMIVMGTHGRRMLSHFILGSVAEKTVRLSTCPVMTVNMSGKFFDIVDDFKRILVPLDFSEYSKAGLKYGIEIARKFGAHLDIIHVFEAYSHPMMYLYGAESILEFNPDIKNKSEKIIEKEVESIDPGFKQFTPFVADGKPNREIISHAEKRDIDLIVLSTRGLGTVQTFFIGSTADRIIRKSKCPVLAVKEHERECIS